MTSAITRLRNAVCRHRGLRGLSLALTFAVMFVAWPQLDLHSHTQGGHTHSHALHHDVHDPLVPDDQDTAGVIHVHDASSVAWTLPSRQTQIASVPLAAWIPELTFLSGAYAARPPPYRPPIA